MNKSKVTVTILNGEYQLMAGSLEEEMYIRKTAKFIEDEAQRFLGMGGVNGFDALIQTTMNIADLLFKERATTEHLRGQVVQFAERSNKLEKDMQRMKTEKVKKEKKENKLPKIPRDEKNLEETLMEEVKLLKEEPKGKREKPVEEMRKQGNQPEAQWESPAEVSPEKKTLEPQRDEEGNLLPFTGKDVRFKEGSDSDPDGLQYNSNLLDSLDRIPIPSLEENEKIGEETPEKPSLKPEEKEKIASDSSHNSFPSGDSASLEQPVTKVDTLEIEETSETQKTTSIQTQEASEDRDTQKTLPQPSETQEDKGEIEGNTQEKEEIAPKPVEEEKRAEKAEPVKQEATEEAKKIEKIENNVAALL